MSDLRLDFLASRKYHSRYRKFLLPFGIFLLVAGITGAGFYLYQKDEKPASQPGQVASATAGQLPKDWLLKYFGTENENDEKVGGAGGDPDGDVLTNWQEYIFGTNPVNPDTDGDGVPDGTEFAFNLNPNGPGELQLSDTGAAEYLESLGPEYEEFSEENIQKEVEKFFGTDRAIVMDLPQDSELKLISQNDTATIEKYFEETKALGLLDEAENEKIENSIFSLTEEELDSYIAKLQAIEGLLKQTSVPSEIVNIHKLKIAAVRGGIRLFELVRDSYQVDASGEQFWSDFLYQTMVVQQAATMEIVAWAELGKILEEKGGL